MKNFKKNANPSTPSQTDTPNVKTKIKTTQRPSQKKNSKISTTSGTGPRDKKGIVK